MWNKIPTLSIGPESVDHGGVIGVLTETQPVLSGSLGDPVVLIKRLRNLVPFYKKGDRNLDSPVSDSDGISRTVVVVLRYTLSFDVSTFVWTF